MKKLTIIFCLCLAILPKVIHGNETEEKTLKEMLEIMANKKETINNIFEPAQNGYLGEGAMAMTYKGTLLHPVRRNVAMKFTRDAYFAEREFEIYTYLNAINNTDVERYGIPAVYYFGTWHDHVLMAMTLLDSKFNKCHRSRSFKEIDILIIAREFVRISKYIHSCGIHHNDIKLENMMFRNHQGFIIDFNTAIEMHDTNNAEAVFFSSERNGENRRRFAKEDWGCFLYAICEYIGVEFNRFSPRTMQELLIEGFSRNLRRKLKKDIEKIGQIEHPGLRRVCIAFAKNVFRNEVSVWGGRGQRRASKSKSKGRVVENKAEFPAYSELYQIITEEIEKWHVPKPALVSWLSEEERTEAKNELTKNQMPKLETIKDRFELPGAKYPEVNFGKDYNRIEDEDLSIFSNM